MMSTRPSRVPTVVLVMVFFAGPLNAQAGTVRIIQTNEVVGDVDFASTRGNSVPYDGVFWLEQFRTTGPVPRFTRARDADSEEMELPIRRYR